MVREDLEKRSETVAVNRQIAFVYLNSSAGLKSDSAILGSKRCPVQPLLVFLFG